MTPNKVILHCSDTPEFMNIGAAEIEKWHIANGFDKIGYHRVIRLDGKIEYGRDYSEMGAHCSGYNLGSVGVCLVGREKFTEDQLMALEYLCVELNREFEIPASEWWGHYEFTDLKTCPNLPMSWVRYVLGQRLLKELDIYRA